MSGASYLSFNTGVADPLMINPNVSLFGEVGYTRVSNFTVDYTHVDPSNVPAFGTTVRYLIPKSADVLGHVDLHININNSASVPGDDEYCYYVDNLGHAMIDEVRYKVGGNLIETIKGEWLAVHNELYNKPWEKELDSIMYTGTESIKGATADDQASAADLEKWAAADQGVDGGGSEHLPLGTLTPETTKELFVPLSFYFTKHPSQYLKLAAVAGSNDILIEVKLRKGAELIRHNAPCLPPTVKSAKLLCHMHHLTGPEAQSLADLEHVNILQTIQHQTELVAAGPTADIKLSFLHPVKQLFFVIRKQSDETTDATRTYFNYTGHTNSATECLFNGYKLILNGQDKHGVDLVSRKFIRQRLIKQLHSCAGTDWVARQSGLPGVTDKEIYVVNFGMDPENLNPSGHINFSKVTHGILRLNLSSTAASTTKFKVDVFALGYNWVTYKGGRAVLSFA